MIERLKAKRNSNPTRANDEEFPFSTLSPLEGSAEAFFADAPLRSAENLRALVFGATGESLDDDLSVTGGHTHDARLSALSWRALASHPFVNRSGEATDPDSLAISDSTLTRKAAGLLWIPKTAAETLTPRLRVSNDAPGVVVICTVRLDLRALGTGALVASRDFVFTTYQGRTSVWLRGLPVDVRGAPVDGSEPRRIPLRWDLSAMVSGVGNDPRVHELQFGQFSGYGGQVGR